MTPLTRHGLLAIAMLAAALGCSAPKRSLTAARIERLRSSGNIMTWPQAEQRLGYLSQFRYTFGGASRTTDDFLASLNVVGLIALKDGEIVLWPRAYSDELIAHNDAFVAALIAALR